MSRRILGLGVCAAVTLCGCGGGSKGERDQVPSPNPAAVDPSRFDPEACPEPAPEVEPSSEEAECVDGRIGDITGLMVRDEAALVKGAARNAREILEGMDRGEPPDRERLEQELSEAREAVADVPVRQQADLDGDGELDSVELVLSPEQTRVGILVEFANGEVSLLGAGRPTLVRFGGPANRLQRDDEEFFSRDEWPDMDECATDYNWIRGWNVIKRNRRGELTWRVRRGRPLPPYDPPGAVGDALALDGGDAFGIYYYDGLGWRWVHAGM
jgi:hypothetical protein